jgi:hypothetical protein
MIVDNDAIRVSPEQEIVSLRTDHHKMAAMLKRLQMDSFTGLCPICEAYINGGNPHEDSCDLGKLLLSLRGK